VIGFIDEGSSSTMISRNLAKRVGLQIEDGNYGGFKNADLSVTKYTGRVNKVRL
jgi:Aspartyl protease